MVEVDQSTRTTVRSCRDRFVEGQIGRRKRTSLAAPRRHWVSKQNLWLLASLLEERADTDN